jgi:hypothetical protein
MKIKISGFLIKFNYLKAFQKLITQCGIWKYKGFYENIIQLNKSWKMCTQFP